MTATAPARYASGRLLFLRGTTLMSQAFDASTGKMRGEPTPVADQVLSDVGIWRGVFDATSNGKLIYEQGSAMAATRLAWFNRTGKQISTGGGPNRISVHGVIARRTVPGSSGETLDRTYGATILPAAFTRV
jgi:hypothetical protein